MRARWIPILLLPTLFTNGTLASPQNTNRPASISLGEASISTNIPSRRDSYAERLQARRMAEEQKMREEAQPPKMTTEQLEFAIQKHQMDVIRRGETPLPIPLSQENEAQLIKEGFLHLKGVATNSFTK